VGLSGSGGSANVCRALEAAAAAGAYTVALTGSARGPAGGPVGEAARVALVVPAETTAETQEVHLALGHLLCELLEDHLAD